jgi:transaldolase
MGDVVQVHERVMQGIRKEREAVQAYAASDVISLIASGKVERAVGHAFQYSSAALLSEVATSVKEKVDQAAEESFVSFVVYMAVGLASAQVKWHVSHILSKDEIATLASRYHAMVSNVAADAPVSKKLLGLYAQEVHDRYVTEARSKDEAAAGKQQVLSGSLVAYVDMMIDQVKASSLYTHAMSLASPFETETVWGNDFGAFLRFALWCGASFQTTNPPLVKAAWDLDPGQWTERALAVYRQVKDAGIDAGLLTEDEQKVSILTYTVVEHSCQLMRDLYLASEGKLGFVCYQVNPNHHGDSQRMVDEINFVHAMMSLRLGNGYEPNISFKVPGTKAALEAAKVIGQQGISLTVTLSFSVYQALEFGRVFKSSKAAVNSVVIMNGRLAFPVRDQLVAENPEEKDHLLETAKWVGVDVTRHLYEKLYAEEQVGGLALDPKCMRILNASLRIYGNDIPDVIEIWGSPSITIFPNVRHALNAVSRTYDAQAVGKQVDLEVRRSNAKSEIFRQSWYVDGDAKEFAPRKQLVLAETDPVEITTWVPIAETLGQFLGSYASTKELIGFMN